MTALLQGRPVARSGAVTVALPALAMALAMLVVAQSYLVRTQPPGQAKVLFVLGLVLAWWVFGRVAPVEAADAWSRSPIVLPLRGRGLSLTIAGALAVIAALYAGRPKPPAETPILWLLSMAIAFGPGLIGALAGKMRSFRPRVILGREQRVQVVECLALAAVIALGAYLRLFDLTTIPRFVHGDEAAYGLDAITLRDGLAPSLFDNAFMEQPRLTTLLASILMRFMDSDRLAALRLSTVLTSLLAFPFLYALARLFVRRPFALLAVFFLAVARVDIHFSRQGINSIQASPLTVIPVYFLLRSLRERSLPSAVLCGVTGAAALYSYFPGRLVPFIIGVLLLFVLLADRRQWREYITLGLAILIPALFVFAPQLGYYLAHPSQLLGHQEGNLVWNNMRHLRSSDPSLTVEVVMLRQVEHILWGLNYYPDSSGQYGARAPLLDSATAILFFLGLLSCFRRWREPRYFTLLAWCVLTALFIGLLTLGTPSAPRLCGLIPAVCLMAGIAMQRIWDLLSLKGAFPTALAALAGFALVPAVALTSNYRAYFLVFARDYSYEPVTEISRYLRTVDDEVTAYGLGPELGLTSYITRLLVPDVPTYVMRNWNEYLPMSVSRPGDALFFGATSYTPAANLIQALYPDGTLTRHNTLDGRLSFVEYRVSAEDMAASRGLTGVYTDTGGIAGAVTRRDERVEFDWSRDLPDGVGADFRAAWDGSIFAPLYGSYTFSLQGSGKAALLLDGVEVMATPGAAQRSLTLAAGWHALHLEQQASGGSLKLVWKRPNSGEEVVKTEHLSTLSRVRGLLASYYAGSIAAGKLSIQAIEPALFSSSNPYGSAYGSDKPFGVTWVGTLTAATAGDYTFAATAHDGTFSLGIDGRQVLSFGPQMYDRRAAAITLGAGDHRIEVSLDCPEGRFHRVELWWAPPGKELVPLSPAVLLPPAVQRLP